MTMKPFRLVWEEDALDDRLGLYEYMSDTNIEAADLTEHRIEESAELLRLNPFMGVAKGKHRKLIMKKVRLFLLYSVDETAGCVRVLRVLHQSMRLPKA